MLVPFGAERETEQLIRAEHLARLGGAELVRESELTPARLAAAIERAAARDPVLLAIDTGGAAPLGAEIAGIDWRHDRVARTLSAARPAV